MKRATVPAVPLTIRLAIASILLAVAIGAAHLAAFVAPELKR